MGTCKPMRSFVTNNKNKQTLVYNTDENTVMRNTFEKLYNRHGQYAIKMTILQHELKI